ncbi:MAG TPA: hypothetical protein VH158_05840 [Gemmatimonadales bacterium]|jgi:hypothetical protein|nr:hypothetical protein [Gemmatimonadales bacterium]
MPLSPIVEAEIRDRFAPGDMREVMERLDAAAIPLGSRAAPSERPRIHLAIIKLAGGNMTTFREAVAVAERDWRDVLVAAGVGNADWREQLARAGMRVP